MALNTDYALRTGAFDPGDRTLEHVGVTKMNGKAVRDVLPYCTILIAAELQRRALERYNTAKVVIQYMTDN